MSTIVSLTAENFKRLKAVQITPDGNMVVIAGRNAQGKSSVLDAIWATLAGAHGAKQLDRPIRDGESNAEVTLDLGELIVTRKWSAAGTKLTVRGGVTKSPLGSPQKVLDHLIGRIAFDPLAFANASPGEQRRTLLDVVGFDPTELDAQRKQAYDERTDVNREAKSIEAQADALGIPPENTPDEQIDVALAAQRLAAARSDNAEVGRLSSRQHDIKRQIDALVQEERVLVEQRDVLIGRLQQYGSIDDLEYQVREAQEINEDVRVKHERARLGGAYQKATRRAQALSDFIDEVDERKAAALANVQMPVQGLGFDDEGVTLAGVPFTQASAAERLKVSVAIAIKMNPEVKVICIRDASLLDADGMAWLARVAESTGYQIWVERVEDGSDVGIVIEDGAVV